MMSKKSRIPVWRMRDFGIIINGILDVIIMLIGSHEIYLSFAATVYISCF